MVIENKDLTSCLKAPIELSKREDIIAQPPDYRSNFMRDRDRIMYSKAFRRLSGKTQVYLSGLDDHQRTRMTHTLEVSQIARTIAIALKLDVDLTEAIALGHDLGHTPFGHIGERTLHEIMTGKSPNNPIGEDNPFIKMNNSSEKYVQNMYGFKHNLQSLKCCMRFETNYGDYGLNLTNFTLFGIQAHSRPNYNSETQFYNKLDSYNELLKLGCSLKDDEMIMSKDYKKAWSFEAMIVSEADEIAQIHHDLEDAIRGNLLSTIDITEKIIKHFGKYLTDDNISELKKIKQEEIYITKMSQIIINLLVTHLITATREKMNNFILTQFGEKDNLEEYEKEFSKFLNATEYKNVLDLKIITYNNKTHEDFHDNVKNFQKETSDIVLSSYDIQKSDAKGKYIIRKLFKAYYTTPQQLPDHSIKEFFVAISNEESENKNNINISNLRGNLNKNLDSNDKELILMRVICDYISGMTDHYAMKQYNDLYN